MEFLKPNWSKISLTVIFDVLFFLWYIPQLQTLFNPYHLPSCLQEDISQHCVSPFRSFTFGMPIALGVILGLYTLSCIIVAFFQKSKKEKKK